MALKVADKYRTNSLSLRPGGYTVIVETLDGNQFEYDKIKNPIQYMNSIKHKKNVKRVWVKDLNNDIDIKEINALLDKFNN